MHLGSAIPMHGRDYDSGVAIYVDFMAGKDFNIGGTAINRADCVNQVPGGGSINIRYKRLTSVAVLSWDSTGRVKLNGKTPTQKQLDADRAKKDKAAQSKKDPSDDALKRVRARTERIQNFDRWLNGDIGGVCP